MAVIRFILSLLVAYAVGSLVKRMKLPAIIGWLISGAILGPNLINLYNVNIMDAAWFGFVAMTAQTIVGVMIGMNLQWKKIKGNGLDIVKLNLFQILGSFILVFISAALICKIFDIPILIALLFANISIALAPGPALFVINQYKAKGPLADTIGPIAATDSLLSGIIFYSIISLVQVRVSGGESSLFTTLSSMIFIPIIIGMISGIFSSRCLKEERSPGRNRIISIILFTITMILAYLVDNYLYIKPMMSYILLGMGFVAGVINNVSPKLLEEFKKNWNPILNLGLIILIVNSSAPINLRLVGDIGWISGIYVMARGLGRIGGNYIGSRIIGAEEVVRKYGGIATLPHSGMSLIFCSVAVGVARSISKSAAGLMLTAVPLAALFNEIIALVLSKKVYEWAGEANKG